MKHFLVINIMQLVDLIDGVIENGFCVNSHIKSFRLFHLYYRSAKKFGVLL